MLLSFGLALVACRQHESTLATADPGDPSANPGACGTARPSIPAVAGTEGLVIARDGTIYYSKGNSVGRLKPSADSSADWSNEPEWARFPGAATIWGITIDPSSGALFVGIPANSGNGGNAGGWIYRIEPAAPPVIQVFVNGAGKPNGLTTGPDGWIYYSDSDSNHIFRFDPRGSGEPDLVTRTPVAKGANGLAFGPDDALYVVSWESPVVLQVNLSAGVETTRAPYATLSTAAADGLAFDIKGRLYVTAGGRLHRVDGPGATPVVVANSASMANLSFGVGVLRCTDIYLAGGPLSRYEDVEAAGFRLPWQR